MKKKEKTINTVYELRIIKLTHFHIYLRWYYIYKNSHIVFRCADIAYIYIVIVYSKGENIKNEYRKSIAHVSCYNVLL